MERELTCIRCPIGCQLKVTIEGDNFNVTGNTCLRGKEYGLKEVSNPTRTVTSSVRVDGGILPVVSVKTEKDIPKELIFAVMEEIHKAEVTAPVRKGDIVVSNVLGTGINIVATKTIERKQ